MSADRPSWVDDVKRFDTIIRTRHNGPHLGVAPALHLKQSRDQVEPGVADQFNGRLVDLNQLREQKATMHEGRDGYARFTFPDGSALKSSLSTAAVRELPRDFMIFVRSYTPVRQHQQAVTHER